METARPQSERAPDAIPIQEVRPGQSHETRTVLGLRIENCAVSRPGRAAFIPDQFDVGAGPSELDIPGGQDRNTVGELDRPSSGAYGGEESHQDSSDSHHHVGPAFSRLSEFADEAVLFALA